MEDYDYDSDEYIDEEEDMVNMKPITCDPVHSDNNVYLIAEEDRSTHFIAIKITNQDIIDNIVKVQREIIDHEEMLQECCMKRGLFHITLAMIRLTGSEGVEEAVNMMKSLQQELTSLFHDLSKSSVQVQCLNNFGQRVVYAEVQPHHPDTLMSLVSLVKRRVTEAGPNVALNDKFGFVPHLTLAKVSRPVARL